ncbi:MAG: hypothetical protein EBS39_01055 [Gammaproteobacteria bacterium]|nr:hypothetical protein [Gammaproteobacteria bacterium]
MRAVRRFQEMTRRTPGRLRSRALLTLGVLLQACGGGGDPAPAAVAPPLSGTFVDLSIAGLSYATTTVSGTTGPGGGFTYRCLTPDCETLTFSVGPIILGSASGASTLTMKDLAGGIDAGLLSTITVRRVQFLIAMDGDAEVANGISIPSALAASLAGRSLDFNATSFDSDLSALIDRLKGDSRLSSSYRAGMQIPSAATARAIAEQAEALARGVLVETPSSSVVPARELRKYVLRVPDTSLVPYSGRSTLLSAAYPRGLRPALGAGISVVSGTPATGLRLRVVTSRGIAVPAPRYSDGVSSRSAGVLLNESINGAPSWTTVTLNSASAEAGPLIVLKAADGSALSGRPTPTDASGSDGARNLDESLQPRSPEFDQRGLDPAGITEGDAGTVWICDRRGPFLVQTDDQGRSLQRIGPAGNAGSLPDVARRLPALLESRQPALGCGGLVRRPTSGEILFALGAALNVNGRTAVSAPLVRLVAFDPRTGNVRQYALRIRSTESGFRVQDLAPIGDDRLLALVRFREGGANGPERWEIRTVDLSGANDISNRSLTSGPNAGLALEFGTLAEMEASGVTPATTSTIVELGALGWIAGSVEGLARADPRTLIVIGQMNGGVSSRVNGGDPALSVAEHQVDRNGVITPRASGGAVAPVFELLPSAFESRQTVIWSIELRNAVD